VLPHPRRIESYVRNLLAVLETEKDAARALLARHMPPLVLTPAASSYRITGGFDLSLCLDEQQTPGPEGDRGAAESMIGRVAGACYAHWKLRNRWRSPCGSPPDAALPVPEVGYITARLVASRGATIPTL
jgi:hypothetical protein